MNQNTELYEKLTKLQWLLQKQHLKSHASVGPMADTTRGQGRILAVLRMKDGISTKDLSYLLGIRISSLNELLAKLEKNGYILREPSETDKRIILIKLTQKGRDEEEPEKEIPGFLACLSDEEQKNLGDYLDRIIAALEAELGTDDEKGEMFDWMEAARERMGDVHFNKLLSMYRGVHGMRGVFGGRPFEDGFPGFGPDRHFGHPHFKGRHDDRRTSPSSKDPNEPENND